MAALPCWPPGSAPWPVRLLGPMLSPANYVTAIVINDQIMVVGRVPRRRPFDMPSCGSVKLKIYSIVFQLPDFAMATTQRNAAQASLRCRAPDGENVRTPDVTSADWSRPYNLIQTENTLLFEHRSICNSVLTKLASDGRHESTVGCSRVGHDAVHKLRASMQRNTLQGRQPQSSQGVDYYCKSLARRCGLSAVLVELQARATAGRWTQTQQTRSAIQFQTKHGLTQLQDTHLRRWTKLQLAAHCGLGLTGRSCRS